MKINIKTPTKAYISEISDDEVKTLKKLLSYKDNSAAFLFKRHQANWRWKNRDLQGWTGHGDQLKAQVNGKLYWEDSEGVFIRPGSIPYLYTMKADVKNEIEYLDPKPYPWAKKPTYELYPYQKAAVEKLIAEKHGNVSLTTGAGKSLVITSICRELGLKTLLVTPSQSIFSEMLYRFETLLGKGSVGAVGDGKKKFGKKFTVSISNSLTRLKPGTKEYDEIASCQVLIIDESHLMAAETLDSVCHGILKNIPYRFFFSGTQTRGDGTIELLQSIIGKTVGSLTTAEAVAGGYICDHEFKIVKIPSFKPAFRSQDAIEMKRIHLLRNPNVAQFIAKLANSVVKVKNESVLILVDEISQIDMLTPLLEVTYAEAKGTGDPQKAVEAFNKGEAKVLIGTSCISTGTNMFPVHHCVNWAGGSSEIKTKQGAVGRSVRKLEGSGFEHLHPPKPKAIIWDFDIENIDVMERHLANRIEFYKDSGTKITRL